MVYQKMNPRGRNDLIAAPPIQRISNSSKIKCSKNLCPEPKKREILFKNKKYFENSGIGDSTNFQLFFRVSGISF